MPTVSRKPVAGDRAASDRTAGERRELRDSETFSSRGEMFTKHEPVDRGGAGQTPESVSRSPLRGCPYPDPDMKVAPSPPSAHILALPPREFCSR